MNDKKRRPLFWGRLRLQYVIVLLAKPLKQKDLIVKRCREIPGEKLRFGHRTSTPGPQTLPTPMQLTSVIDLTPSFMRVFFSFGTLLEAIDPIYLASVDCLAADTMNLAFKAWKLVVEMFKHGKIVHRCLLPPCLRFGITALLIGPAEKCPKLNQELSFCQSRKAGKIIALRIIN